MKISVCIPTYNRASSLENCLNSIYLNSDLNTISYEVCISDNNSNDSTQEIISSFKDKLEIKSHLFDRNYGRVQNYLKVVEIATGDFIWLIGDDDLLLPTALKEIYNLIITNKDIDFFYINSYSLDSQFLNEYPKPFDTKNIPKGLPKFSKYEANKKIRFIDLINPKISFDYVGAMFLAVFKRENWVNNQNILSIAAMNDPRTFSHYDNTFPHVKIFAKAFAESKAFFYASALSVNLMGLREWSPMSPLINLVRLPESLHEYKKNGLSLFRYIQCMNYSHRTFWPDFVRFFIYREKSGYEYINPLKLFLRSLFFPYAYISPLIYLVDFFRKYQKK